MMYISSRLMSTVRKLPNIAKSVKSLRSVCATTHFLRLCPVSLTFFCVVKEKYGPDADTEDLSSDGSDLTPTRAMTTMA